MFNKKSHTTQVTPTLAGFATGSATTVLTVAATLVSLRSEASREGLFLVLSWTMYVAAAGVALVSLNMIEFTHSTRVCAAQEAGR